MKRTELVELAEQITEAMEGFVGNDPCPDLVELDKAIQTADDKGLKESIEIGINFLDNCGCEDVKYYRRKINL